MIGVNLATLLRCARAKIRMSGATPSGLCLNKEVVNVHIAAGATGALSRAHRERQHGLASARRSTPAFAAPVTLKGHPEELA